MTAATVIGFAAAVRPRAAAVVLGVLVGLLWLAVLALAAVAGWVWLRNRGPRSEPASRWLAQAAWTTATAFLITLAVIAAGVAG